MNLNLIVVVLLLFTAAASLAENKSASIVFPGTQWDRRPPSELGMNENDLKRARDYALTGGGAGVIVRGGRIVMAWGDTKRRFDLKSTTKSIGFTAFGLAMMDGKVHLRDKACKFHPSFGVPPTSNEKTGWLQRITFFHLATQTAGFEKTGGYGKLLFPPGTKWSYSDGGPNWLAECLTLAYRRDLKDLLFERVFTPIGVAPDDLQWRENAYRPHEINGVKRREFGSGISANVEAMARIGYLYLRRGEWKGKRLLPENFVEMVGRTQPGVVGLPEFDPDHYGDASDHYGLLWWNNADGRLARVPRDAFWSWGLYESLIVVIPSLDLVAARAGRSWRRNWSGRYDVLEPFFDAITASIETVSPNAAAPCPPSRVITGVDWAPPSSIVRRAQGSDNWPMTWADDDALYTAYGDGWGFEPKVSEKLSLGFAKITGGPTNFRAVNIRTKTGEQKGDGPSGKKASGILMVDGTLYLLARNAQNAQLAWSTDHARTWRWADWRFRKSFGCPSFLNFGKNYAGARDAYVYIYSPDSDSAYDAADGIVLARVPKRRLRDRAAYEFYGGIDDRGAPIWTTDVEKRAPVLAAPKLCLRTSVCYNAGLRRYLMVVVLGFSKIGLRQGLAIYDAPEPWGPWTTVYFTKKWDVDPGESARFPTKWISPDGRTAHLVFSGNDSFCVRLVRFRVAPE